METQQKDFIETYQCPGCILGDDVSCFEKGYGIACGKHIAGTTLMGYGKICLGMPKGFNRLGDLSDMSICGFNNLSEYEGFDKLNVPVWKYKNAAGHTFVRGLSPRINAPFIYVFMEDCIDKIDCIEITDKDLEEMD